LGGRAGATLRSCDARARCLASQGGPDKCRQLWGRLHKRARALRSYERLKLLAMRWAVEEKRRNSLNVGQPQPKLPDTAKWGVIPGTKQFGILKKNQDELAASLAPSPDKVGSAGKPAGRAPSLAGGGGGSSATTPRSPAGSVRGGGGGGTASILSRTPTQNSAGYGGGGGGAASTSFDPGMSGISEEGGGSGGSYSFQPRPAGAGGSRPSTPGGGGVGGSRPTTPGSGGGGGGGGGSRAPAQRDGRGYSRQPSVQFSEAMDDPSIADEEVPDEF
jgi:microtubule-associated protein-like 5